MKTKTRNKTNYVDALDNEPRYAVLTKPGRIQILVQPTAKQLRKRGSRGWHLFGTVGGPADAPQVLHQTLERALSEAEGTAEPAGEKGKKPRPPKAAARS
jgi:hypothetical protein